MYDWQDTDEDSAFLKLKQLWSKPIASEISAESGIFSRMSHPCCCALELQHTHTCTCSSQ